MNYRLVFDNEAIVDIEQALDFYESSQAGLGLRFIEELEHVKELIAQNPRLFPKKKGEFREALLHTFPFLVVYRIDKSKSSILVVAVFHASRNPKIKLKRIK